MLCYKTGCFCLMCAVKHIKKLVFYQKSVISFGGKGTFPVSLLPLRTRKRFLSEGKSSCLLPENQESEE